MANPEVKFSHDNAQIEHIAFNELIFPYKKADVFLENFQYSRNHFEYKMQYSSTLQKIYSVLPNFFNRINFQSRPTVTLLKKMSRDM